MREVVEALTTQEFAAPQNPEKKALKAALTCGKMVLKKGGKATCCTRTYVAGRC